MKRTAHWTTLGKSKWLTGLVGRGPRPTREKEEPGAEASWSGAQGLWDSGSREGEQEGDKLVPPLKDAGFFITSNSPLCRL